jgi:signal transduction histidine kinase
MGANRAPARSQPWGAMPARIAVPARAVNRTTTYRAQPAVDSDALNRQPSDVLVGTFRATRAIQNPIVQLSEDVCHLAHQFHPSIFDDVGFPIALQRLVDAFTAYNGVKGWFMDYDTPRH